MRELSAAIPWGVVLQPGETLHVDRSIATGAARGTPGMRMAWGENREASPDTE